MYFKVLVHSHIRAISRLQTHQGKRSPAQNSKADLGLYCWKSQCREGGRQLPQLLLGSSWFCIAQGKAVSVPALPPAAHHRDTWSSPPPATLCPTQKALPAEELKVVGMMKPGTDAAFHGRKYTSVRCPFCELGWDNKIQWATSAWNAFW